MCSWPHLYLSSYYSKTDRQIDWLTDVIAEHTHACLHRARCAFWRGWTKRSEEVFFKLDDVERSKLQSALCIVSCHWPSKSFSYSKVKKVYALRWHDEYYGSGAHTWRMLWREPGTMRMKIANLVVVRWGRTMMMVAVLVHIVHLLRLLARQQQHRTVARSHKSPNSSWRMNACHHRGYWKWKAQGFPAVPVPGADHVLRHAIFL